jgi:hypothetical protein
MIVDCLTYANEVTEKATYGEDSTGNTETIKQTGFYWQDAGEKPIMS